MPTLVLFFSSQSGEGHSQWAWPFTSIQEAPKLQTKSSQDVGASGPVEEMVQSNSSQSSLWWILRVARAWKHTCMHANMHIVFACLHSRTFFFFRKPPVSSVNSCSLAFEGRSNIDCINSPPTHTAQILWPLTMQLHLHCGTQVTSKKVFSTFF